MKPKDCIYCGNPSGSAEHTILAALGGLRTHRGILCGSCNQGFGNSIDSVLAADMKALNGVVGAQNGRTKEPITATATDPGTGRSYLVSEARRLQHPEALVITDTSRDGMRSRYALASSQKQADDFVHEVNGEGKPVESARDEHVPLLFASTPLVHWDFGGTDTFRAVARLVLNLVAVYFPSRARDPGLGPLKDFIMFGGAPEPWVHFDYLKTADPRLPPDSFPFQHRFVVGFDAPTGLVYGRVSLLGVIELSVRLGVAPVERSETFVYDMDVLARMQPGDIAEQRFAGESFAQPGAPTPDPSVFVPMRLARVLAKRLDRLWSDDAPPLIAAINSLRAVRPSARHLQLVETLRPQGQRLLNLTIRVARRLQELSLGVAPDPVREAFDRFAEPDASSRTGVTEATCDHLERIVCVMADHISGVLDEREIVADELRQLLEADRGASVIGWYMMREVEREFPASA